MSINSVPQHHSLKTTSASSAKSNTIVDKTIDIHCHLPAINPYYQSLNEIELKWQRKLVFNQVGVRAYCYLIGIEFTPDVAQLNLNLEHQLVQVIGNSALQQVVVLAMDGAYNNQGQIQHPQSMYYVSNEKVYQLAKRHHKILAGASINPQRWDALHELELAIDHQAALIKLHPVFQWFDTRNPKFKPFWDKLARSGIPALIHAGFESSLPGIKINKKANRPQQVLPLLEAGCTVILAHGGGTAFLQEKEEIWFSQVVELLEQYDKLFLDTAALFKLHTRKRVFSLLNSPLALERLVFGSDFPVSTDAVAFIRHLKPEVIKKLRHIANPLDKHIELARALGFSEKVLSRGCRVVNMA